MSSIKLSISITGYRTRERDSAATRNPRPVVIRNPTSRRLGTTARVRDAREMAEREAENFERARKREARRREEIAKASAENFARSREQTERVKKHAARAHRSNATNRARSRSPHPVREVNNSVVDLSDVPETKLAANSSGLKRERRESKKSNNDAAYNCPVCLEKPNDNKPMSTICGHIFCFSCIEKVIQRSKKCPICNKNLKMADIHPIFF